MESVEKIRILVGLNVDKYTVKIEGFGKFFFENYAPKKKIYKRYTKIS